MGRLVAGFHDLVGETTQLRTAQDQSLQRFRILRVVACLHVGMGVKAGVFEYALILPGQFFPFLEVHIHRKLRTAFPPAGKVVVLGDLVEAQLLVVVGPHPFGGIDHAFFQRRIDVIAGDHLLHHAELGQHLAGKAATTKLEALEIANGVDLLAIPAAHLRTGVAAGNVEDVVVAKELTHQLQAAGLQHPRRLLAAVEAEGDGGIEGEGGILANVPVTGGVSDRHRAILDRIQHSRSRYKLTGGEYLDLKFAAGSDGNMVGNRLGRAVDGVEALGVTGGQPPFDLRTIGLHL